MMISAKSRRQAVNVRRPNGAVEQFLPQRKEEVDEQKR